MQAEFGLRNILIERIKVSMLFEPVLNGKRIYLFPVVEGLELGAVWGTHWYKPKKLIMYNYRNHETISYRAERFPFYS